MRGHPKPNIPRPTPKPKPKYQNTCAVAGCNSIPWHMGVCKSHYPTISTDGSEWPSIKTEDTR